METWVGLLRNSCCVLKDLSLWGMDPFTPVQHFFPKMLLVECLIGPMQGLAFCFNMRNGLSLLAQSSVSSSATRRWKSLLKSKAGAKQEWEHKLACYVCDTSSGAVTEDTVTALCLLAISHGFIWLFLNSFKATFPNWIIYGLIGMEGALAILLVYMARAVLVRLKKARVVDEHATSGFGESLIAGASPEIIALISDSMKVPQPSPPWPGPAVDWLAESYLSELTVFRSELSKKLKSKKEATISMLAFANSERLLAYLDIAIIVLNVFAFFGYFTFIITFYFTQEQVS